MLPVMGDGATQDQDTRSQSSPVSSTIPKWVTVLVAALGTLGVLGAVGAFYIPGVLDRVGAVFTDRVPLEHHILIGKNIVPNYIFSDSVSPYIAGPKLLDFEDRAAQHEWARVRGGILGDEQQIRLILRGRSDSVVHIEEIRVRVIDRTTPRSGWYNANWGCGGVPDPRVLRVDLDLPSPSHAWYIEDRQVERPSFTVTTSEEEVFDITVETRQYEVKWVIDIVYNSTERSGTLEIRNGDDPFVVSSVSNARAYGQHEGQPGTFVRSPDRDGSRLSDLDRPVC